MSTLKPTYTVACFATWDASSPSWAATSASSAQSIPIELKVREFRPEDLGKLSFYLEALDRDVKKPHERPSIGLLLCATKDAEVVEYALSRTLSPALVAEYQIALPPKALLQAKLHELYEQLAQPDEDAPKPQRRTRSTKKPAREAVHRRLP